MSQAHDQASFNWIATAGGNDDWDTRRLRGDDCRIAPNHNAARDLNFGARFVTISVCSGALNASELVWLIRNSSQVAPDGRRTMHYLRCRLHRIALQRGDPFSEDAIRAANPAFDTFMNKGEVLAMAAAARRMPSREAEYRRFVLNQRTEVATPFVPAHRTVSTNPPQGDCGGQQGVARDEAIPRMALPVSPCLG
jgi:hypothetical protein